MSPTPPLRDARRSQAYMCNLPITRRSVALEMLESSEEASSTRVSRSLRGARKRQKPANDLLTDNNEGDTGMFKGKQAEQGAIAEATSKKDQAVESAAASTSAEGNASNNATGESVEAVNIWTADMDNTTLEFAEENRGEEGSNRTRAKVALRTTGSECDGQPPIHNCFRFLDLPAELRVAVYKALPLTIRTYPLYDQELNSTASATLIICKFPAVTLLRTNSLIYREAYPIFWKTQLAWAISEGVRINICDMQNYGLLLAQVTTCLAHDESSCMSIHPQSAQHPSVPYTTLCYRGLGGHSGAHRLLNTLQHYRGPLVELRPVLQRMEIRLHSSKTKGHAPILDSNNQPSNGLDKTMHSPGFGEVEFRRLPIRLSVRIDLDYLQNTTRRSMSWFRNEWEWYWLTLPHLADAVRSPIKMSVSGVSSEEEKVDAYNKKNLLVFRTPAPSWVGRTWLSVIDQGGVTYDEMWRQGRGGELELWEANDWIFGS